MLMSSSPATAGYPWKRVVSFEDTRAVGARVSSSPIGSNNGAILKRIVDKVRWLSTWTVHYANKLRGDGGVGGHQNTSASMVEIIVALEVARESEDDVVLVPHSAPAGYSLQALIHNITAILKKYRTPELPAYPSHLTTALEPAVTTVPSGSLARGPVFGFGYASSLQYLKDHGLRDAVGHLFITVGNGEMAEGLLKEGIDYVKQYGGRNVTIIVNQNRQRLDQVIEDGETERIIALFEAAKIKVKVLQYGTDLSAELEIEGMETVRTVLDGLVESQWQTLIQKSGQDMREWLRLNFGDQVEVLLDKYSNDAQLESLLTDFAGHDVELLIDEFRKSRHNGPTAFIVSTVKGRGLPELVANIHNH